ncbi:unnamed protein product [Candida verbasci]|uniref:Folylpolyglutamate synthase n=1 Tax=Candida verbasci TaxID=1227364 RepID=A0A9W4TUT5_9ASCO|nr:unnamed protein product [Candida verbasci]
MSHLDKGSSIDPNSNNFTEFMIKRTYKDAINALNSLQSNFASVEALKKLGPSVNRNELSINEVYEYTKRLGYSPSDFNKLNIIHVTGTKGKGSTCAFTESILRQYQGSNKPIHKIGLYTSPHLKSVRERIRINGEPINKELFTKYFFEVWDKLSTTKSDSKIWPTLQPNETIKPMYFKYLTILSFHVFLKEGIDTAIYEVGVGGTYDSTNIIEKPIVTGISALGIDHTFMLGNTINSITENKTGIFKKNCPAYVSKQVEYPESEDIIKERGKELKVSSLEFVNDKLPENVELGLSGDFQKANAALAIRLACTQLTKFNVENLLTFDKEGNIINIPKEFIQGLKSVNWPGRCQITKDGKITWYIDGAHTIESISASSKWFKEEHSKNEKDKRLALLFNQQGRENYKELLTKLYNEVSLKFDDVIFTPNVTWESGDYNSELLSKNTSEDVVKRLEIQNDFSNIWSQLDNRSKRHVFSSIESSIKFLKEQDVEIDVFVCGSLHLVGGFQVVLDNDRD